MILVWDVFISREREQKGDGCCVHTQGVRGVFAGVVIAQMLLPSDWLVDLFIFPLIL